jgi:hypothetical protein
MAMSSVELWLRVNNDFTPVLPVHEPCNFSLRSLRWLCFLGYTIYGREGDLSATEEGEPVDYTPESSQGLAPRYTFVSS